VIPPREAKHHCRPPPRLRGEGASLREVETVWAVFSLSYYFKCICSALFLLN